IRPNLNRQPKKRLQPKKHASSKNRKKRRPTRQKKRSRWLISQNRWRHLSPKHRRNLIHRLLRASKCSHRRRFWELWQSTALRLPPRLNHNRRRWLRFPNSERLSDYSGVPPRNTLIPYTT